MRNVSIVLFCVVSGICLGVISAAVMAGPLPLLFGSLLGGGLGLLCSSLFLWKRHHRHIFEILSVCFIIAVPVAAVSGLTAKPFLAIGLTASTILSAFFLLIREASRDDEYVFKKATVYLVPIVCIVAVIATYDRYPEDIPSLIEMMGMNDMQLRSTAANRLKVYGKDPFLIAIKHKNPSVRATAAHFLGLLKDPTVVGALIESAKDPYAHVRMWTAFSLGEIGDSHALPTLDLLAQDGEEIVRLKAQEAIEKINERSGR